MSVRFVIDSASDVLPCEAQAMGVTVLPMTVTFGQQHYCDGVDLTHKEFYEKLVQSQELPTTSQIPPAVFADAFEKLVSQGHQVVCIVLSSGLSGTYQSAMIAASEFEGQVFVVDSLNATIGERILLMRGLELAQQGMEASQIAGQLTQEREKIRLVAIVDTLEYLKKGGRVSSAAALAGGLLGIKPAIEVKEGKVITAGTARGSKKANSLLQSFVANYGGVNMDMPVAFVYAYDTALLEQWVAQCPEVWQSDKPLPAHSMGGTIGTHVGPGAYGVAFFEK